MRRQPPAPRSIGRRRASGPSLVVVPGRGGLVGLLVDPPDVQVAAEEPDGVEVLAPGAHRRRGGLDEAGVDAAVARIEGVLLLGGQLAGPPVAVERGDGEGVEGVGEEMEVIEALHHRGHVVDIRGIDMVDESLDLGQLAGGGVARQHHDRVVDDARHVDHVLLEGLGDIAGAVDAPHAVAPLGESLDERQLAVGGAAVDEHVVGGAGADVDVLAVMADDHREGAFQVIVSHDGKNVYVGARTAHNVLVYSRAANGKLTLIQTLTEGSNGVRGIDGARYITEAFEENVVYVSGIVHNTIVVLARDPATGELTQIQTLINHVNATDINNVTAMVESFDHLHLFATAFNSFAITSFHRDRRTGKLTAEEQDTFDPGDGSVNPGLIQPTSAAMSPGGQNLYTVGFFGGNLNVWRINEKSHEPATAGDDN